MLAGGVVLERRARYVIFARGLIGGGWAALYFTTYAAHGLEAARVIDNPLSGMLLLVAVAAALICHSLTYRREVVTGLAYGVGFITLILSPLSGFALAARCRSWPPRPRRPALRVDVPRGRRAPRHLRRVCPALRPRALARHRARPSHGPAGPRRLLASLRGLRPPGIEAGHEARARTDGPPAERVRLPRGIVPALADGPDRYPLRPPGGQRGRLRRQCLDPGAPTAAIDRRRDGGGPAGAGALRRLRGPDHLGRRTGDRRHRHALLGAAGQPRPPPGGRAALPGRPASASRISEPWAAWSSSFPWPSSRCST